MEDLKLSPDEVTFELQGNKLSQKNDKYFDARKQSRHGNETDYAEIPIETQHQENPIHDSVHQTYAEPEKVTMSGETAGKELNNWSRTCFLAMGSVLLIAVLLLAVRFF